MTDLAQQITVTLDLTPDTVIGRHQYRQIGEDEYTDEPMTLLDAVIEKVAERIEANVRSATQQQYGTTYGNLMSTKIEPRIDARVEELVTQLFERSLQPTDPFGTATGPATSLEKMVVDRVESWLEQQAKSSDTYSRNRITRMDDLVTKVVDRAMTTAMDKVVKEAQAKVLAALTAEAEKALGKALRDTVAKVAVPA